MGYKSELWDRLDYAAAVGCRNLVLNSNGTLLDRWDNIDKILASPLRRFILSLDGLSKETFELIREKAKWEEVYPAVEELCRRRIASGQQYPAITAQFSVMNVQDVDVSGDFPSKFELSITEFPGEDVLSNSVVVRGLESEPRFAFAYIGALPRKDWQWAHRVVGKYSRQ